MHTILYLPDHLPNGYRTPPKMLPCLPHHVIRYLPRQIIHYPPPEPSFAILGERVQLLLSNPHLSTCLK